MSQTVNYGLNIYTDNEVEALGTVRVWRAKVDGTGSDSNMVKLDSILKNIADSIPTNVVYIEANPTLEGTESVLNSIKIGSTKYKIPSIAANETLSGNETTATSLTINGTKYAIPQGTTITANPTLDGTETDLEGISINGVNYAIPNGGGSSGSGGGEPLYEHVIYMKWNYNNPLYIYATIISTSPSVVTFSTLPSFLYTSGYNNSQSALGVFTNNCGYGGDDSKKIVAIYALANSQYPKCVYQSSSTYISTNGELNVAPSNFSDTVTQITTGAGGGSGSGGGSAVEANPTLDGTETTLTGLGIDGTNYAMPHLYEHRIHVQFDTSSLTGTLYFTINTTVATGYTKNDIMTAIYNLGATNYATAIHANGFQLSKTDSTVRNIYLAVYSSSTSNFSAVRYNYNTATTGIITNAFSYYTNTNNCYFTDIVRQIF